MSAEEQKLPLQICSFSKLCGFWCDLYMIMVGILLCEDFPVIGAGLIIIHLVFSVILVFHQKLGFTYNICIARLMILIPDILGFTIFMYLYSNYPPNCFKQYYGKRHYHYRGKYFFLRSFFGWCIQCFSL